MMVTEWKCGMVWRAGTLARLAAVALMTWACALPGSTTIAQEVDAEIKAEVEKSTKVESEAEVKSQSEAEPTNATPAKVEAEEKPAAEPNAEEAAAADGTTVTANKPVFNSHSEAMTLIHNRYRAQSGLSAQEVDPQLSLVAQQWAEHMAYVGSMYHGGGEQIIAYSGGDRSYEAGFRTWLGSSPHRAWLCSRGNRCGFGYAIGRNGCAYYAGAFGSSYTTTASTTNTSNNQAPAVTTATTNNNYYQSASYNNGRRFRFRRR